MAGSLAQNQTKMPDVGLGCSASTVALVPATEPSKKTEGSEEPVPILETLVD